MKERQDRLFELWKAIIYVFIFLSIATLYYMISNSASFFGALCCGAIELLLLAVVGLILYDSQKPQN
jgi:hypothetical protein